MRIPDDEEFTRDWDWFASDPVGAIGHFTTAGFRRLPRAIKEDWESAETCIRFFTEGIIARCAYSVSEDLETLVGGLDSPEERERYLRSFIDIAGKGLFSFDTTPLTSGSGHYLLVARPTRPLTCVDIPAKIAALVRRVTCPTYFQDATYLNEVETWDW
jgi:hypothetical protein